MGLVLSRVFVRLVCGFVEIIVMPRSAPGVPLPRRTHKVVAAFMRESNTASKPASLTLRRENAPDRRIILHIAGTIDTTTQNDLRDTAFTVIGLRPAVLCLNLVGLDGIPDAVGIQTLTTISRVASLVNVSCMVYPSHDFAAVLKATGLIRLLPLDESYRESDKTGDAEMPCASGGEISARR